MLGWIKSFFKTKEQRMTDTELEVGAAWGSSSGEPMNEAARELCRRSGETWLLED